MASRRLVLAMPVLLLVALCALWCRALSETVVPLRCRQDGEVARCVAPSGAPLLDFSLEIRPLGPDFTASDWAVSGTFTVRSGGTRAHYCFGSLGALVRVCAGACTAAQRVGLVRIAAAGPSADLGAPGCPRFVPLAAAATLIVEGPPSGQVAAPLLALLALFAFTFDPTPEPRLP